jgi:hypothetical protein
MVNGFAIAVPAQLGPLPSVLGGAETALAQLAQPTLCQTCGVTGASFAARLGVILHLVRLQSALKLETWVRQRRPPGAAVSGQDQVPRRSPRCTRT